MKTKLLTLFYLLTLISACLGLTACGSDDDEPSVSLSIENVVGIWDVTNYTKNGETISLPKGVVYMQLKEDGSYFTKFIDNTYTGTYVIKGNTVVGTTTDPVTEYYKFASLSNDIATINYSNSWGDSYTFTAVKRK